MIKRNHLTFGLLLMLAGCDSAPVPVAEEKGPPATFPGGEYEVTALTETLRSTDRADSKSAPSTRHKAGSTDVSKICSPVGPKPSVALFADAGDSCATSADYARDGGSQAFECAAGPRPWQSPSWQL